MSGASPNFWVWPSQFSQQFESFKSRAPTTAHDWRDCLRQDFDSILLDCPTLESAPEGVTIAARAEAAVLAVDVSRNSKHQVQLDQRLLQSNGVSLKGCIRIKAN